jgi:hypothetical protein
MALVSPGLQITVTDESQYVSAAVGTVPLVFLATAQDKIVNGSYASGTSLKNAGKLQVFGSQRELVSALGYPKFQQTSAGTPINGDERNEYGLMAAYSALGLGNQVYAIRADIDLNQLKGTAVRPAGTVADGTYWFDLADTSWGIFEWDASTQSFTEQTPIVITSASNTTPVSYDGVLVNEPTPLRNIGQIGSYAVVTTTTANRIFHKRYDNTWYPIGSTGWQNAWPVVTGTATNPLLTSGQSIVINGVTVTLTGTSVSAMVSAINTAAIPGITARTVNNRLAIYATKLAQSNGSTADGRVSIANGGSGTLRADLGLSVGTVLSLGNSVSGVVYGSYVSVPQWDISGNYTAPSGAIWLKTGTLGGGSNFVFQKYNALTDSWTQQAVSSYKGSVAALYGLDPVGGGSSIGLGTIILTDDPNFGSTTTLGMGGFRPRVRTVYGAVKAKAAQAPTSQFTSGNSFNLQASTPGSATYTTYTITVSGTRAADFVSAILYNDIPYVTAAVEDDGSISITHIAGGNITLTPLAGQQDIPTVAGFVAGVHNVEVIGTSRIISGFSSLSYTYSLTEPFADPADGTLWYYSDATTVDIMINDGTKWRGYRTLSADARGYNLANTDPAGLIVSPSMPVAQSDNSSLVSGDLWLDTSDLENYPKLSRYNGSSWVAIDKSDQISQNGIVFADARWDTSGTTDPIAGSLPSTASLLTSDYVDLDAPDARLYPRGMIMWNMRRSGYNIKRWVGDYFNYEGYNSVLPTYSSTTSYVVGNRVVYGTNIYVCIQSGGGTAPQASSPYWSILMNGSWVSASGLANDGSMYAGHHAQRSMVVEAIRSAIDSNTQIREEQFQFNLICAPGYPEAISNMVALNNDRSNTAFVIGDTPLTLSSNVVDITNWSNDTNGDGLGTADPYLAVYWPSGLSNDAQGNPIIVPPSHVALRTYLHNDSLAYPWFAPAGTRRGMVDNVTDIGYIDVVSGEFMRTGVSHALRDSLYSVNINPITVFPGMGILVWGQKTRNPVASSLDRVNVARLVNYIRTILSKVSNGFMFEPNDKITRDQLKAIIESSLNDLVSKRGIYDYLVVVDETNNTPDRIARNELYVDIAIEPMKDVEFVYIPIRLLNPGSIASGNLGSISK